jgi:carbon-monoxide dehydrogenase large subunit
MTDTTIDKPAAAAARATQPAGPIGQRVERKEDMRFLTGAGQYTDDVTLPNQSYAYFLRSPHAHAKIRSIKTGAAMKAPGVLAI